MTTENTATEAAPPLWAVSIEYAAQCLRVTPRRVRQLIEDGLAVRHGRGRVDIAWLMHAEAGRARWGRRPGKPAPLTLVALGWLAAHDFNPEPDDVPLLLGVAERNGHTAEAARVALGVAPALFPAPAEYFQ